MGLKRVGLNLNLDREGILKEYSSFLKKRRELYLKLSKSVMSCWIEEKEELK